jgi:hypothetical protein
VHGVTPLRVFQGLYAAVFAVVFVLFFVAPDSVRIGFAVVGAMVAFFGVCLAFSLFGMPQELAEKAKTGRWTPPVYASVKFIRFIGVFFAVVGTLFALQAAFSSDF